MKMGKLRPAFFFPLSYTVLLLSSMRKINQQPFEGIQNSTVLSICFILEDDSYFTTYSRVAAAVELGIQHANSFVLSKPLTLQTVYQSSGASCTMTMFSAVEKVFDLLDTGVKCSLFLGPTCPYTAAGLYGFAKHLDVPIFALPAMGAWSLQSDARKKDFPLIIQPGFGVSDLTNFVGAFLQLYDYQHISIFRDDSFPFYGTLVESFTRFIRDKNQELFKNSVVVSLRSKQTTRGMYISILRTANERSRVFLLFVHATAVRELMIAAYRSGFTFGDHIFIGVELYDLAYWGKIEPVIQDSTTDPMAMVAYQSLLVISFLENKLLYNRQFEREIKLLARQNYNYTFNPLETLDPVLTAHYEAVILYATAISMLVDEGQNFSSSEMILSKTLNQTLVDNLGGIIRISSDGYRNKDYCIKFYNNRSKEFEVFIEYTQQGTANGTFRFVTTPVWPGGSGRLPPNEPPCGFRDDKCIFPGISSSLLAVAVVIPLLVVGALVISAVFAFIKLWKVRMAYNNPNWWMIDRDDLLIRSKRVTSGSKRSLQSQMSEASRRTGFSTFLGDSSATYKGIIVGLTDVSPLCIVPSKGLVNDLSKIRPLDQANLQHFIGISITNEGICEFIIAEFCSRGSLSDVLENEMIQLDWSFKNSFIRDLVFGMTYLHSTTVMSHGHLSSFVCLIDARFSLKIADYGLPEFQKRENLMPPRPTDTDRSYTELLWRAPELLRQVMPPTGTQKGDIYSFAIIMQQIILRSGPFELPGDPLELSEREIIDEIVSANIPPVRPRVPRAACSNELYDLLERCWEENPIERPPFLKTKERIRKILGNIGENIVDLLFKRIEQYAASLEQKVADQTQQFMDEKFRSEQLLSQLLPKTVAAALTKGVRVDPEAFESVTIFFSDIVGFTTIAAEGSPMDVISLLNNIYTFFDAILELYDVYKVETIGDAYMVSSGLPIRNGNKHAAEISCMALDLQQGIAKLIVQGRPHETIKVRVGINSGPCVAGIVGNKMPRYCLFGDTVNVASRMESTGEPMKIQIGRDTKDLLSSIGGFLITERGPVTIKGKGVLTTFWLITKH